MLWMFEIGPFEQRTRAGELPERHRSKNHLSNNRNDGVNKGKMLSHAKVNE
jgi:hypothetical protein